MHFVLMVGGGVQQKKAISILHDHGFKVIVTDRNENAPCALIADYFVKVDGKNIKRLAKTAFGLKKELNLVYAFTLTELVDSIAEINRVCGFLGAQSDSTLVCQDKAFSKAIWLKHGIATPKGGCATTIEQADKIFEQLNRHVFVKPVKGAGSLGAREISSVFELNKTLKPALNNQAYIIEELIEGDMFDVNAIFDSAGNFIPLGCFQRFFDRENIIELGAVYPTILSEEKLQQAYKLTAAAASALGISRGPVKADLVKTATGFVILELAPRLHGPKGTLWLSSLVDNTSQLVTMINVLTKRLDSESICLTRSGYAGYRALISSDSQCYREDNFKKLSEMKEVEDLLVLSDGYGIRGKRQICSNADVPAYVFTKGNSIEEVNAKLDKIYQNFCAA